MIMKKKCFEGEILGQILAIKGRAFRMASMRHEPYQCLGDPETYIAKLRETGIRADLFTFMQEIAELTPKHSFHLERESLAVVPVTDYQNWWKKQVNDKTRNMIRKAQKNGVEFRLAELNDDFVRGVVEIYNEVPMRQGKAFSHYGMGFQEVKEHLNTFTQQSDFIGAYWNGELIGFVKFVRGNNVASLMQIISKIAHRDKAPTNGLVAKAVERCEEMKIQHLHYSVWSKRGLGDFKRHLGFVQWDVPRYYVPLTLRGKLFLACKLHRNLAELLPDRLVDSLVRLRTRWNGLKVQTRL